MLPVYNDQQRITNEAATTAPRIAPQPLRDSPWDALWTLPPNPLRRGSLVARADRTTARQRILIQVGRSANSINDGATGRVGVAGVKALRPSGRPCRAGLDPGSKRNP